MRVLVVAPQPFFSPRGTPIATKFLVEELVNLGYQVDILTFHLGEDLFLKNVNIIRTPNFSFIRHIPIGFSIYKIFCDIFLIYKFFILLLKKDYEVVHAIEESIFPAVVFSKIFKFKLIYDMDSRLFFPSIKKTIRSVFIEKFVVFSLKVIMKIPDVILVPSENLRRYVICNIKKDANVTVIRDYPLIFRSCKEDLRKKFNIGDDKLFIYTGNLYWYQGVEYVLQVLSRIKYKNYKFVIIGGNKDDIERFKKLINKYELKENVFFLGTKPLKYLLYYLVQADYLVAPRISSGATPMKIMYYKLTGIPVIASSISSHVEILDGKSTLFFNFHDNSLQTIFTEILNDKAEKLFFQNNCLSLKDIKKEVSKFKAQYSVLVKNLYISLINDL